jgi:hypothetical protein
MFISSRRICLLTLLSIIFSFSSYSKDIEVIFVKGKTYSISMKGKRVSLKKGDFLVEGDTIITEKKSFAILKIENHSTHKIEAESEIYVRDLAYFYEGSKQLEQGANLFVKAGTIFSKVQKVKGKKSLVIESRNSAMGVRGTELLVSVDRRSKDVILAVKTGEVEIENKVSGEKEIIMKKQGIYVGEDLSFSQPKKYLWIDKLSWNMTTKSKAASFIHKRKVILKEIRKKKAHWIRNEVLFKQKETQWGRDQKTYDIASASLSPNKVKATRVRKRLNFIKKQPKDLANGINNKSKLNRNSFADQKEGQISDRRSLLRSKARARALERMKNDRRRRYQPGQNPTQTVPSVPPSTGNQTLPDPTSGN